MRRFWLVVFVALFSASARAETQLKPFAGIVFNGETNYTADVEFAAGKKRLVPGFAVAMLGNIFGIEGEVLLVPGFLGSNEQYLVTSSQLVSYAGSVIVAMPYERTKYTLRPYLAVGMGGLTVHVNSFGSAVDILRTVPAANVGGGATGFFSRTIGVNWDLRYFRNVAGNAPDLTVFRLPDHVSFWRVSTALVIKQ